MNYNNLKPYQSPSWLVGGHLQTIVPSLFRKVEFAYERERVTLPDGDFLDLDWRRSKEANRLVIISHGLEGDSHRPYAKGMAKYLSKNDLDVLVWNFRGCSGEGNKNLRFYHSGATDDLKFVVDYASQIAQYQEVYLCGFSLGGNVTLKLLGENQYHTKVKKAVVFSVPSDLAGCSDHIAKGFSQVYSSRFLKSLTQKIKQKAILRPELSTQYLEKIQTLRDFDEYYTAPLHGFDSAADYYEKCSANRFISAIRVPTLMVNALNDPFLSEKCYPEQLAADNPFFKLEIPKQGGHCGFIADTLHGIYWSEKRAATFLLQNNN